MTEGRSTGLFGIRMKSTEDQVVVLTLTGAEFKYSLVVRYEDPAGRRRNLFLEVAKQFLKPTGAQILIAKSGLEAMKVLETDKPDLIIWI